MRSKWMSGATVIGLMLGTAGMAQQGASEATRASNAAALAAASGDEARERAEDAAAHRGFVAAIPDGVIHDAAGHVVWDWRPFAFLNDPEAPATVNPRLWRQARRNAVHGLFEVVPGAIWQVRGYDISVMTIIRGDTGWIIVDPLTTEEAARASMALVTTHLGARPIRAILFSHSHGDHFGGVGGVIDRASVARGEVRIIAPQGFAREAVSENVLAGPAMLTRAGYMFGSTLAAGPMGQVDTGLGPRLAGGVTGYMAPTETVGSEGGALTIDGVEFDFIDAAGTEAPAEFAFYIPRYHALHTTEVVTKTFHNLLTLRGAQVRDALHWSQIIDDMAARWGAEAQVQLGSHGWPTFGNAGVRETLAEHRDLYRYVHDRTLGAANRGATIQELPDMLEGVAGLAPGASARGYYGTINHNAKAVYQRYFGWWDGVPAHYDPLTPEQAGRGYVELAGGAQALLAAGRAAHVVGNDRWAAELLNHLLFADGNNSEAKLALADAYEQLGYQAESGAWRNYYLTAVAQLRSSAPSTSIARQQSEDFVDAIPTLDLFNALATRLAATQSVVPPQFFRFVFTDTDETVTVERRGVIEIPRLGESTVPVTAEVRTTRTAFAALLGGRAQAPALMAAGQLSFSGDVMALQAWLASHAPPTPGFAVVTP